MNMMLLQGSWRHDYLYAYVTTIGWYLETCLHCLFFWLSLTYFFDACLWCLIMLYNMMLHCSILFHDDILGSHICFLDEHGLGLFLQGKKEICLWWSQEIELITDLYRNILWYLYSRLGHKLMILKFTHAIADRYLWCRTYSVYDGCGSWSWSLTI